MTSKHDLRFIIENVNANLRLSGIAVPPEVLERQRRVLAGEITVEEAIEELHRKYRPAQNDG